MRIMYPLAAHLRQCQRDLHLHPVSELLLLCFYITSLWQQKFLFGRPLARSICSIFLLSMESNAIEKSTNNSVASFFFLKYLPIFEGMSKYVMSWIDFFVSHFGSAKEFSQFQVLWTIVKKRYKKIFTRVKQYL